MFKNMLVNLVLVISLTGVMIGAQESPVIDAKHQAKPEDIRKLLKATNGAQMGRQVVDRMIQILSKSTPNVPDSIWSEFQNSVDWDSLVSMLIPVYQRYLSKDDIKAMTQFYESKAGRHLIAAQPTILQESMSIGQKMGEEVMSRIVERLKEKGYDPPVIPH